MLLLVGAMLMAGAHARATLSSNYNFTTSSGTYVPLTTGTTVIAGTTGGLGTFNDAATGGPFAIGLNFVFDCVTYSQFTFNAHGMMILGTLATEAQDKMRRPSAGGTVTVVTPPAAPAGQSGPPAPGAAPSAAPSAVLPVSSPTAGRMQGRPPIDAGTLQIDELLNERGFVLRHGHRSGSKRDGQEREFDFFH